VRRWHWRQQLLLLLLLLLLFLPAAACCSAVAAIVADVFPILRPPADFFFSGHPNCRLAWLAIMA